MRRGFTLVEMTVVLLIIAIATHLAMRQLGGVRDRRLVAAADRQLEDIRGAAGAFLSDMGRMVTATNGTLAELWQIGDEAKRYRVCRAVKANLAKGAPAGLTNENVYVATGWRGPYLRLPLGKSRLMDPWGNPIEVKDAAGLARVTVSNGFAVAARHYGPTALEHDADGRSVSLLPEVGASSRLVVKVVSRGGTLNGTLAYKWFGPKDGMITGGVTNGVAYGVPAVFDGLTPGVRMVWDSASGVARQVKILPGDNQIEIEVP